eukprot:SAG31_NODE_1932_length_6879_cov_123.069322_6_plen_84_part_00
MVQGARIRVVLRLRPQGGDGAEGQPLPTVVPEVGPCGSAAVARLRGHSVRGRAEEGETLLYELDRVYGPQTAQRTLFQEQVAH